MFLRWQLKIVCVQTPGFLVVITLYYFSNKERKQIEIIEVILFLFGYFPFSPIKK